jgi:hypothetical protein
MLSLYFKTKPEIPVDKHRLIEIFFKDWIDTICDKQVEFRIERNIDRDWIPGMVTYRETFRVDFEQSEDVLAVRLTGIPHEFENLIEFVK